YDPVPLGLFLAFAGGPVAPGLGGGDPQDGDAVAGAEGADFGVGPEVADQDDLVDAARHVACPLPSVGNGVSSPWARGQASASSVGGQAFCSAFVHGLASPSTAIAGAW